MSETEACAVESSQASLSHDLTLAALYCMEGCVLEQDRGTAVVLYAVWWNEVELFQATCAAESSAPWRSMDPSRTSAKSW